MDYAQQQHFRNFESMATLYDLGKGFGMTCSLNSFTEYPTDATQSLYVDEVMDAAEDDYHLISEA